MSSTEHSSVDVGDKRNNRIKKKKAKKMLKECTISENLNDGLELSNLEAEGKGEEDSKMGKRKKALEGDEERGSDEFNVEEGVSPEENNEAKPRDGVEKDDEEENSSPLGDPTLEIDDKKMMKKKRKLERLMKEAAEADNRGICYLSRIPPHMDHVKLRHILSQYGEIKRIYLAPEDPAAQVKRKRGGGYRGQEFSEGWVEFAKKTVAKRVANLLNGEQIGGRKRSAWYYDLWNIKYLSKFKWDDLTEEIAHKMAIREQKLALEISAAKRERDFYISKVEQSRALAAIEERMKKKQKSGQNSGEEAEGGGVVQPRPKVIRQFPQKQPVVEDKKETKSRLSRDVLAGVFGAS